MSIRSPQELERMRAAGLVVRRVIEAMKQHARAGITTAELDAVGARVMCDCGGRSAPSLVYGFPGTNCISVNNEVVHGIPSSRQLRDGDVVKLDVTVEKNGFMADAAVTIPIGTVRRQSQKLIACAENAFNQALLVARAGVRVSEIGRVIEQEVRKAGFSVIRDLGGHGIGRTIHEEPRVPNFDDPTATDILTKGLVITVEPIIATGSGEASLARDGWTVKTADRTVSAHYEHTIMITEGTPLLLTAA